MKKRLLTLLSFVLFLMSIFFAFNQKNSHQLLLFNKKINYKNKHSDSIFITNNKPAEIVKAKTAKPVQYQALSKRDSVVTAYADNIEHKHTAQFQSREDTIVESSTKVKKLSMGSLIVLYGRAEKIISPLIEKKSILIVCYKNNGVPFYTEQLSSFFEKKGYLLNSIEVLEKTSIEGIAISSMGNNSVKIDIGICK